MKVFRTIVYTALILGITAFLVVRTNRQRAAFVPVGKSPAAMSLRDATAHSQPAWVLIHSASCPPCIEMAGIFTKLRPEFKDKVKFINIDSDDPAERQFIDEFGLRSVPISVYVDARGRIMDKELGAMSEKKVRSILARL